ncbi:MAG TPA: DinB family protein, partial [Tepidisphaeraceae bacterium]|nr:DinB family protein [Tepidisphaeraceae bacterium]
MAYAETILPEFDQEMAKTRKVLERIPDDKLDWQPHPKSHTIGWNASHVTDLLNWIVETLTKPSVDIAPVVGKPYVVPKLASGREILEQFDRNVAAARNAIE